MKKLITILASVIISFANAQAYKGKGDTKFQVGSSFQSGGSGIHVSTDLGIGENMSYGFVASYLLKVSEGNISNVKFGDRFDCKARFNANIGNVLGLDKKMDVYPGLDLGFRYFFTQGFGLYTEAGIPLAKYDSNVQGFEEYNNQFVFQIGASFNL